MGLYTYICKIHNTYIYTCDIEKERKRIQSFLYISSENVFYLVYIAA